MTDETTPGEEAMPEEHQGPEPTEAPESAETESAETAEEKSSLKEGLREGAAKAFGVAVEIGSMLSGESGDLVEAERDLAAAEAEDLIDRIDGEG